MERVSAERGPYTQRDLLPLLRVKPHVLRYWEQTLPLVRSRRDDAGHRLWSAGQVRMLLRIRHLVVERGVSVPAAGEALLREAGGEIARVKAGLERVRNSLVVLLLRVQSLRSAVAASPNRGGTAEGGTAAGRATRSGGFSAAVIPSAVPILEPPTGLPVENLIARGLIPPVPGGTESQGSPVPPIRIYPRIALNGQENGQENVQDSVRLVYTHLFGRESSGKTAELLAALVRHRLAGDGPLIIAAPEEEEDRYREVFSGDILILGVPSLVYEGHHYNAPTLAVLAGIASNRDLDRYMQRHHRETICLWAADNPHSTVVDYLTGHARLSESGIALGLYRTPTGHRLSESVAVHLPAWRPRFGETMRCGRWVRDERGRRYVLWLRDLARLNPPGVLLPALPGPSVWRGSLWSDQVRLVWPEIQF